MTYDYLETMKGDIRQWLEDNDWKDTYKDMTREELEEKLNEDLYLLPNEKQEIEKELLEVLNYE